MDEVRSNELYLICMQEPEADWKRAITLINDPTVDVNYSPPGSENRSPLRQASFLGHTKIVEALLNHPKIQVNKAKSDIISTPIFTAAQNGHEEIVKMLLCHPDINPNLTDKDGISPIWMATQNNRENVIKMFLALADNIDLELKTTPGPESWRKRTAAEQADNLGLLGIAELLNSFTRPSNPVERQVHQRQIKKRIKKELELPDFDPVRVLVLTVMLCDGFFVLKTDSSAKNASRFFHLMMKLPFDLQMVLCNRLFDETRSIIPVRFFNNELRRLNKMGFFL